MNFRKIASPLLSMSFIALIVNPLLSEEKSDKKVETVQIKASDLVLNVPKSWKQQQPSNNLRLAQFVIPAAKEGGEPAELVISGPFGGTVSQNVQRWMGQFKSDNRKAETKQGESKQGKYVLVDITGTYNRSIGPPFRRQTEAVEDYRVINVMLTVTAGRGGNYFLKLTGEKETVGAVADQIRAIFGANTKDEKALEL